MTAGGSIAGLAGAINGHTLTRHISPGLFGIEDSIWPVLYSIAGGLGTHEGAILGTLVVRVFWEWSIRHVGGFDSLILIGLSLALVVTALPRGVYPVLARAVATVGVRVLPRAAGRPVSLLEVRRLSKHFGGLQALSDVDFEIAPGEVVGLAGKALAPPQSLTIVELRRLELARALATGARLLLLDEINTGLTQSEIVKAIRLIQRVRDRGATILMVEHLVRLIMSVCDRIVVLDFGRKIAEGAPAEIGRNPEVIRAYLGRQRGGSDAHG